MVGLTTGIVAALLLTTVMGGCTPTDAERINGLRQQIQEIEFQRRDIRAQAMERRAQYLADRYRYSDSPSLTKTLESSYQEEAALQEKMDGDLDANLVSAIRRLERKIATIQSESTPHRAIWLGTAPGDGGRLFSWSSVLADPETKKWLAAGETKDKIREAYWATFVSPMIPTADLAAARIAFDQDTLNR